MKKWLLKLVCVLGCAPLMLFVHHAYATQTHTKLWNAVVIVGPLGENTNFRYYFEPDARFVDDKYKFQQMLLWLGLGYRFSPTLNVYVGDAPDTNRNFNGTYQHQNIVWQQISWNAYNGQRFNFMTNSRLEEIKRTHERSWEVLLRQMQLFKLPMESWKDHSLVLYDSLFFQLNSPKWTGYNTLISQNRAFIGIEVALSNNNSYTIGYMNQYIFANPDQMNHVFTITFNINNEHQNL